MKNKNLIGSIALILIGILFGAVLVSSFGWVRPGIADVIVGAKTPPVNDVDANSFSKAFIDVANKVTPSIVKINVLSKSKAGGDNDFFFFFPFHDKDFNVPKEQLGSGSGVIISKDGYILTNNHVVENASKVEVSLYDRQTVQADVVGTDPLTDLAVIKVHSGDLPEAYLGNSDDVQVGQWVMAIGNPLALSSTVTAGIISAKGRNIGIISDRAGIEDFIQTDAAINPGNSGGALVDLSGAVIGINTAIAAGQTGTYIGYGFAIPINLAKNVAKELIANGKVNRGYIGVNISAVDPATAKAVGLDKTKGIMVQGLLQNGAAEKAGIKEGDIILKVDGKDVDQPNTLQSYIATKSAGSSVNLTIFRDGKTLEKSVTLKPRDNDTKVEPTSETTDENNTENESTNQMTFDNLGLTIRNLTKDEAATYKVEHGVMITDVKLLSRADDQEIRKGYVITQIDKKDVKNVRDFESLIKSKKGSAVLLRLVDGSGAPFFRGLEIPQ
jgi:serine protease Do